MSSLSTYSLHPKQYKKISREIDDVLGDKRGLPNGKGRRTNLTDSQKDELKLLLIIAVGQAASLASNGPLKNRVQGRGRPPDNVVFIFIDDIARACSAVGLKPGRRFVDGSQSLPAQLYNVLAPTIWGGTSTNPCRQFQRWHRNRSSLSRRMIEPSFQIGVHPLTPQ
jgi:hypothetical protein